MAADRIIFPKTNRSQLANRMVSAANALLDLMTESQALTDIVSHDINAADYSALETELGITAGTGANFATLLGNLNDILNVNTVEVTAANRIARLKEFVSRVACQ